MNREKLAWSASVGLLAVLAFQIPGTLAQRDDDYAFVRTLVDIHRRVADNYVDPVDEPKLNQGAIDGMLDQLDPFSVYVPPEREEDFDRMLSGNFKGVGIRFDQHPDGTFEIVTPVDGSPAARSGIQPGDMLLAVDGKSLENVRLIELPRMVGGAAGHEGHAHRPPPRRPAGVLHADPGRGPPADRQGLPPQGRTTVGTTPFATTPRSATSA